MAQDSTPSMVIFQGDGSNRLYSIPFDKGYYGEVRVAFVRRGPTDYEYNPDTYTLGGYLYAWGSVIGVVYTDSPFPVVGSRVYNDEGIATEKTVSGVDETHIVVDGVNYERRSSEDIERNNLLHWAGEVLGVNDYICIVRDTLLTQPFVYPNNQKHIENALDNLERQIQEVKSADGFALHVDPSYETDPKKMNPIDWLQTIIRSKDLSVRAFRFLNGWVDYSFDDPEKADADREWFHLLNTDNIVSVREMHDIDEEGNDIYWTEYLSDDGVWRTLSNAPAWEKQLDEIKEVADNALAVAEEAKTIAGNAEVKSDLAITKSESAFSMATESLAKSDTALANSEYAVETSDTANAKSDVAVATSARAEDKSDTAVATSARAETKAEQATWTAQEAVATANSASQLAQQTAQTVTTFDGRITEAQNTAAEALQTAESAEEIAKGAQSALSFADYQTFVNAFNSLPADTYKVGQNALIVTVNVPDLWVSGIEETSVPYTYTTDEAIVDTLKDQGYFQVGYYRISQLETGKINLEEYQKKLTAGENITIDENNVISATGGSEDATTVIIRSW